EMDLPEPSKKDIFDIFDSPEDPSHDLLETSQIDMEDLSDLIEHGNEPEIDDLSTLLDDPKPQPDDLDDLSSLIEMVSTQTPSKTDALTVPKLDDLSVLIQASPEFQNPEGLDDLSLLIEPVPPMAPDSGAMDNLSLLIAPEATAPDAQTPMDDLYALIDDKQEASESETPMDDLNALIGQAPSLKPDITPEENLKEYKAVVMKTILRLKTDGLSAEESTRRLNQDGVQTISGKAQWSEKAILQIYKFIDSVK
ncbi:MAG: recombinase family protein, partial [Proteobacteria bacterium]|nr:recombinase family protein [Pseudomonadota bacterium]